MIDSITLQCAYKVQFRIRNLSDKELNFLVSNCLDGVHYRTGSDFKNRDDKVLVIPIVDTVSALFLRSTLSALEREVEYEFIISTCNNNESFIIDLPEHTCGLIREIGGGISFSYTYAGDDCE